MNNFPIQLITMFGIGKLPRMTPGKQRGRAVRVPFSIPITFRLQ